MLFVIVLVLVLDPVFRFFEDEDEDDYENDLRGFCNNWDPRVALTNRKNHAIVVLPNDGGVLVST